MTSLYLIAHINGACIAINSDWIESLVHVYDVVPAPKSDPVIVGLFALRSRVLTLIDTQFWVTGQQQTVKKGALAVVAEIAGHHYGLLVDSVEDVVSIQREQIETRIKPPKEWAPLVEGTASVSDKLIMILDPVALVNGPELLAA
jgi:purine-binding chemotaxis protein CheW